MLWLLLACSNHHARTSLVDQLDREVVALRDHVELLEGELATCTEGGATNAVYPELKQVFSGSEVGVEKVGPATRLVVRVSQIYADPTIMKFRQEADPMVDLLATAIQLHPELHVAIVGHTSDRPLPTTLRREHPTHVDWSAALAGALVRRFVEEFGCEPSQFSIGGRGPYAPRESNDLESGRDANFRLEIWLQPGSGIIGSSGAAPDGRSGSPGSDPVERLPVQ